MRTLAYVIGGVVATWAFIVGAAFVAVTFDLSPGQVFGALIVSACGGAVGLVASK